ncbi:MAG: DUF4330 family protein [Candidatus Omnitrophica bacterium]|nr:DUF4330 family protein [Candidatus Omnitrophota bacterium]
MKIIDEKGVIFKKINIADFLIVLYLIIFSFLFYYAYKKIKPTDELRNSGQITLNFAPPVAIDNNKNSSDFDGRLNNIEKRIQNLENKLNKKR